MALVRIFYGLVLLILIMPAFGQSDSTGVGFIQKEEAENRVDGNGLKQGLWEKKEDKFILRGHFVDDIREGEWTSELIKKSKYGIESVTTYDNNRAIDIKYYKPSIDSGQLIKHVYLNDLRDTITTIQYDFDKEGNRFMLEKQLYVNFKDSCNQWTDKQEMQHKLEPCKYYFYSIYKYNEKGKLSHSEKVNRIANERVITEYDAEGNLKSEVAEWGVRKVDRRKLPPGSPETFEYFDSTEMEVQQVTKLDKNAPEHHKYEKEFNENGLLKLDVTSKNFTEISRRYYYDNGEIRAIYLHSPENPKEQREAKAYYPNGLLKTKVYTEKGKRITEEYDEDGKLSIIKEEDGDHHTIKTFYGNGKLRSETLYKNGEIKRDREYDPNGNVIRK